MKNTVLAAALSIVCLLCHARAVAQVSDVEIDGATGRVKSLISGRPVGEIAVAGRLYTELHAHFMAARTEDTAHVLNWYNLGYSGGDGSSGEQGGTFGNFGLDVPWQQRTAVYPLWAPVAGVPAVGFNGQNIIKADYPAEPDITGNASVTVEVWVRNENPAAGEVILGWQSADGDQASAPLAWPDGLAGSTAWRHIVVAADGAVEQWYVDGAPAGSRARTMTIAAGHRLVLGGASGNAPSFTGRIAAVRVHRRVLDAAGAAGNAAGGVMLGTTLVTNVDPTAHPGQGYFYDTWSDAEPENYFVRESPRFRYRIANSRLEAMTPQARQEHEDRMENMLLLSEACYQAYSEIHALRMPLVSAKAQYRGDGVKYRIHIAPTDGASWMGWHGDLGFGYPMQGPGHMNPHELVHGVQAQTGGGMQGNYWEVHANFPQTWIGVWQSGTAFIETRDQALFEATGRSYYDAQLMMRHLAHTPQYGPMFISKLWYSGEADAYPWITFDRFNPDPETSLGYEWARMVQRNVTWDYVMHPPVMPHDPPRDDHFASQTRNNESIARHGRVLLHEIPYLPGWYRPAKIFAPQQTGWNLVPLHWAGDQVTVDLQGYTNPGRGGDWHYGFVAVDSGGGPRYSDIRSTSGPLSFSMAPGDRELYLVVAAIPTKVMAINMVGDVRSSEQEPFPYRVRLEGASPRDVAREYYANKFGGLSGAPHPNGGGFVAHTATVAPTAYVGPEAWVVGNATVSGNARIEDRAVVDNATVQDNAILSGYALASQGAVVRDHARVRDFGWVRNSTLAGTAKVVEYATLDSGQTTDGRVTIKGLAYQYGGNASGTAILDHHYAKGNEITRGKWFSWSWGGGQNPGEIDQDFGGLYLRYTFANAHPSMAWDDHGITWGYLWGRPVVHAEDQVLVLDGQTQFVELQQDVSDHYELAVNIRAHWAGGGVNQRLFDFGNSAGNGLYLTPENENGRLALVMTVNGEQRRIEAATALPAGQWVQIAVVIGTEGAHLFVDGQHLGTNGAITMRPFLEGAGAFTNVLGTCVQFEAFFEGMIDEFSIYNTTPVEPGFIAYPSTSADGQFTVEWGAAEGAQQYRLERSDDGGTSWSEVYSGSALSYGEIVGGGTYVYRVRAVHSAGVSLWVTGGHAIEVAVIPPVTPASLQYPSDSSTGRFTVSWPVAVGAQTYTLQRSADGGGAWTTVYSGSQREYAEMVENGLYRYRVCAVSGAGVSGWRTGGDMPVSLTAMEGWRRTHFGEMQDEEVAGPQADPNMDGICNLLKFALRGDPLTDDAAVIEPRLGWHEPTDSPVFRFRVRTAGGAVDEQTGGYTVDGISYCVVTSDRPGGGDWVQWPLTPGAVAHLEDESGAVLQVHLDPAFEGTEIYARLIVLIAE